MNSYGKLCTQYYDLDKPQPPEEALAFYLDQARVAGGPVLEPMCGSGRFLLPLMQAGIEITGIDSSPEMLAACRHSALRLGITPKIFQQFLHEMDVPGLYALVMIPSGSFGLITDLTEARESLRRIYDHLVPGGRFVLEIDQMLEEPDPNPEPGESSITRPDGAIIKLISSGTYDSDEMVYRGINRYELVVQERMVEQELEQFYLRYYQPHVFVSLLEEAGFEVQEAFAAFDRLKPLNEAESYVVIANKP